MNEIDFNPATMTRATFADVQQIHEQLWGLGALNQYMMIAPREDGEVLDLTQQERSMNNGHGQFTSADAKEYIVSVQHTERVKFSERFTVATNRLVELLGNDFDEFWDSYPEQITKRDFLPIMEAKIAELEQAAQAAESNEIAEWLETDTRGDLLGMDGAKTGISQDIIF